MSSRLHASVKYAVLAVVLVVLAGCDHPYMKRFQEDYAWTEARMLSTGWLSGEPHPPQHLRCYETIADTDCFVVAKPAEKSTR